MVNKFQINKKPLKNLIYIISTGNNKSWNIINQSSDCKYVIIFVLHSNKHHKYPVLIFPLNCKAFNNNFSTNEVKNKSQTSNIKRVLTIVLQYLITFCLYILHTYRTRTNFKRKISKHIFKTNFQVRIINDSFVIHTRWIADGTFEKLNRFFYLLLWRCVRT